MKNVISWINNNISIGIILLILLLIILIPIVYSMIFIGKVMISGESSSQVNILNHKKFMGEEEKTTAAIYEDEYLYLFKEDNKDDPEYYEYILKNAHKLREVDIDIGEPFPEKSIIMLIIPPWCEWLASYPGQLSGPYVVFEINVKLLVMIVISVLILWHAFIIIKRLRNKNIISWIKENITIGKIIILILIIILIMIMYTMIFIGRVMISYETSSAVDILNHKKFMGEEEKTTAAIYEDEYLYLFKEDYKDEPEHYEYILKNAYKLRKVNIYISKAFEEKSIIMLIIPPWCEWLESYPGKLNGPYLAFEINVKLLVIIVISALVLWHIFIIRKRKNEKYY